MPTLQPRAQDTLNLFLCGDVMTGRGIDQVLPRPGNPVLYEGYVRDAREYVRLAEVANGPIPWPVDPAYPWGEALAELQRTPLDARIINLETGVTTSEEAWPGKGIHYRMHPDNLRCLTVAGIDCCCLANNHILDWGRTGLSDTLQSLDTAGLSHAGAGPDEATAALPARLEVPGKGAVLVYSFGSVDSGIPAEWGATPSSSGVQLLPDLSAVTARRIARRMCAAKQQGEFIIASIHWGGNWGYQVSREQTAFAHRLIDAGVDLIHGHSAHHVKPLEIYRDRLILYGCGDFINDYEGIPGYEQYRSDLRVMYLLRLDPAEGRLLEARLVPLQSRRFRLLHASDADTEWLTERLNSISSSFKSHLQLTSERDLRLQW